MKLLVTGGAGFIGSAFVRRRISATDDTIVVLDKLTYAGNLANLAPVSDDPRVAHRLEFVRGDIAEADDVRPLVGDVDAILNFAAESHVDRSILDAEAFLRTGVIGVHVLLEAARERAAKAPIRFLQVSTDEVYGDIKEGRSVEADPIAPRSPYAAAKAAGEVLARSYHSTFGLDVVVTRGANTFGPYQHPEKLIPLFVTNALDDHELPMYGDGLQERDWLHVDDHADGIGLVLDRGEPGAVYNLPGGSGRTNRAITTVILETLGKPWSLVRSVPDRPGHDRRYAMAGGACEALGWTAKVPFEDGLVETVHWYRDNRPWWEAARSGEWDAYYERQYGQRLSESVSA